MSGIPAYTGAVLPAISAWWDAVQWLPQCVEERVGTPGLRPGFVIPCRLAARMCPSVDRLCTYVSRRVPQAESCRFRYVMLHRAGMPIPRQHGVHFNKAHNVAAPCLRMALPASLGLAEVFSCSGMNAMPIAVRIVAEADPALVPYNVGFVLFQGRNGGNCMIDYLTLGVAAFSAGLVDAVVGGGGLIQIPAIFSVFTTTAPATLLGTNKLASVFGTSAAAVNYARRVRIAWSTAAPASMAALVFAFVGAYTVTRIPPDFLRSLLPLVLIAVAVYTFKRKDLGSIHAPLFAGLQEKAWAIGIGALIGFYDGFFGPGTGSFLVFLFVRFFGFDFLSASAVAKVVNVACNIAALAWFGWSGHLIWQLGLTMAVCNVCGSLVGTKLALKHGSGFVRRLFLVVVSILIVKTSYDAWLRW